jgi:hypothetical protein
MQSNRRERLLAWATYQPRPLFWAARLLARLLPGGPILRGGATVLFTNPETTIRSALCQIGNGAVSPSQLAALSALVEDVKRSAGQ